MDALNNQKAIYIAGRPESIWSVALKDMVVGLADYRLWMFLGWQDIKSRYRRSMLGPFWLTISTGIMVGMMSILYGRLFRMPMEEYGPFLAAGTIVWTLISTLVIESCSSFIAVDSLIKQVRMPLTLHVCRMVWRNIVVFFHNIVILIPVWIIFGKFTSVEDLLLALIGLVVIAINAIWVGIVLGAICTRFRDIPPIVTSLVQVVFFVTPVMWMPTILQGKGVAWWLIVVNPFYHFIEIVRAPLLGSSASYSSWLVVGEVTMLGMLAGMYMLGRFRTRIPYWL